MEISEREYHELVAIAENNPREKFCIVKFIKGWINKKFLAAIVTTVLVQPIIHGAVTVGPEVQLATVIVWGVVLTVFILGGAIDSAVSNAKLSAEFKAGANFTKNITGKE